MARGGRVSAPYSASSAKLPKNRKLNGPSNSNPSKAKGTGGKPTPPKKAQPAEIADTYTYTPAAPKRARASAYNQSLSRDESGPSTRRRRDDEDEDEDAAMEERIRQVAMRIAGDELLELDESEESDVDSDAAWESEGSDEERWGDVFRDLNKGKGKKGKSKAQDVVKKPAKPITVNLDESDDEESPTAAASSKKGKSAQIEQSDEDEDEDLDEEELDNEGSDEDEDLDDDEDEELEDDEEDEFAQMQAGSEEAESAESDEDEVDLKAFKPGKMAVTAVGSDVEDDEDDEGDEGDEGEEDEEEDSDDDDEHISDPELPSDLSDEEEGDADLDDLDAFVDGLAAGDDDESEEEEEQVEQGKKRKVLPVVPGPAVGEVGLQSNGKLDITSLLSAHPSLSSAKALLPSRSQPSADASKSILKSGVLSAPLPTVVQHRLDREAAYEKTKEEGQKWSGVMRRVREAEHLSFPLQAGEARGGTKSGGEMISAFKPVNPLESAVQALLDKANLNTEHGLTAAEDAQLQGQDLTVEEIAKRRADLRYQRELMFRAEKRAKRVAKIKSKTFRKLARKRAEKEGAGGLSVEDLEKLDPEAAEAQREKLERARAKERATQRHGARTKFGTDAMKGDFGNEDRRSAREEMLDQRERLTRKIAGRGSDEEFDSQDEGDSEDDSEQDGDDAGKGIKSRAFDQLNALDKAAKAEQEQKAGKKGLMQMAFMQRAQEKGMRAVRDEEDALRRDIEMFGEEGEGNESSADEDGAEVLKWGEGRMVFSGPAGAESTPTSVPTSPPPPTMPSRRSLLSQTQSGNISDDDSTPSNPWLQASSSGAGPSRKRNTATVSAADKATQALKKVKGRKGRVEMEEEDGRVDIDLGMPGSGFAPAGSAAVEDSTSSKNRTAVSAKSQDVAGGDSAPTVAASSSAAPAPQAAGQPRQTQKAGKEVESEDEETAQQSLLPTTMDGKGRKRQADFTSQRDLVAEAFAGDDVVADFEKDKKRQMEADAPQVEDNSLPGWGSWSGKGLKKRKPNPKFLVKTAGIEAPQRKDFGRDNVIISEKSEKRAKQFLAKDLPYPYTSVAQYEASFNTPVGAEWNSRKVHQRETMPRVIKKPGAIIEPVRRLF